MATTIITEEEIIQSLREAKHKDIRSAMAEGAQAAMSEKTYRGIDALIIMDRDGICMKDDRTGYAHRVSGGVVQYFDTKKWIDCDFNAVDFTCTSWRIVPDPSQPEAKPTPGTWAREFLTGIRDQINKFLEASQ
jgi:hypothetical protein